MSKTIFLAVMAAVIVGFGYGFCRGENQTPALREFRLSSTTTGLKPIGSEKVITRHPFTVEVTLPEKVRIELTAALDASPPRSVKLSLRGMVPPQGKPHLVRGLDVYANLPPHPSPKELSQDSDYWVGAIDFGQTNQPQGFNLDLARPLVAQRRDNKWAPDKPLTITLVAVPADPARELPKDLSIPVKEVTVSVPRNDR